MPQSLEKTQSPAMSIVLAFSSAATAAVMTLLWLRFVPLANQLEVLFFCGLIFNVVFFMFEFLKHIQGLPSIYGYPNIAFIVGPMLALVPSVFSASSFFQWSGQVPESLLITSVALSWLAAASNIRLCFWVALGRKTPDIWVSQAEVDRQLRDFGTTHGAVANSDLYAQRLFAEVDKRSNLETFLMHVDLDSRVMRDPETMRLAGEMSKAVDIRLVDFETFKNETPSLSEQDRLKAYALASVFLRKTVAKPVGDAPKED